MQERLLILGGNRYNVPSIREARQAGFVTLVADRDASAPGLAEADVPLHVDVLDIEGLMAAVREHGGVDGVVSMAEVGVRPAAALAARWGLPSISQAAAANATSKAAMRHLWSRLGDYSVDFRVAATEAQAVSAVRALGRLPVIIKPDRSFGGSRGVSRVERLDQVPAAFRFAQSGGLPGSRIVVERCVDGTEHSAEVLIWKGRASILCIGEKTKSAHPYRVDVSVQYPARLSPDEEQRVAAMCQAAVSALGLDHGVAHVEFAHTVSGPVLFELGARCGGGHTPQIARHVSGISEFVELCRMACGGAPERLEPLHRKGADYRFLVFRPGTIRAVELPEELSGRPDILDIGVTTQPGDVVRPLRTTADRAGFVVAVGPDRATAAETADHICQKVWVTYADGSRAHALGADQLTRHVEEESLVPSQPPPATKSIRGTPDAQSDPHESTVACIGPTAC